MKNTLLILVTFIFTATYISAQNKVSLQEKLVALPTYPVAPAEKSPIFFRGEAYQGASRHYYPLKMNDQYLHERVEKEWKHLVLENEFIELAITPEIGGKLYYATDKTNGYNFVYKNNVVKPSNIGMTGAWVSGGIEWCVLHHHRASTFLPVDYTTTENADGSKTIWVAESEPRHGMRWTIGVTVFPGKAYFKTEGRIFNASPVTHTFLYWANVAAHANENYQTIFPPSAQIATFHSKTDFTRWPVSTEIYRGADFSEGVDISWWKNVEGSNSFFVHDLQEDFMGGYDHGNNSGTVHIGDHNVVKGAKLWEWGSGPRGQATEGRLTENDGPYVEIMVGAYSDNQPDYTWIRPYEVKTWEQYWYPVKGIGGFKNANLNGAVNLEEREDNTVFLGFYSTQQVNSARVVVKNKESIVFERSIEISPREPFAETINMENEYLLSELHASLLNEETGEVLIDYQPQVIEPVKELPEPWKGYPSPEELETVEELYLTGKRVEQFYAPQYNEMDWYREALKRDPGDIRTNTAVGNHYLKNGDYLKARTHLARAIKRLTADYTRPSDCEALYLQGLTLKALGLYEEAIDTLYRAAWDYAYHSPAYYQLAQVSVLKGEFNRALKEVNESLSTNVRNNRAVALKASLQRKMGNIEDAGITLANVAGSDPLDFRLRYEQYLLEKESGNNKKAELLLSSLKTEMRDFDENYLDLAVGYINDGFFDEAEGVLNLYRGSNPIFDYYLGYLSVKMNDLLKAKEYFTTAAGKPVDFVFPHRLLTVEVLKTALEHNPLDGKAFYYIGNIFYEKQPELAIESWKEAVKNNSDLEVAHRNLGWGYYRHYKDVSEAIAHYEKAIALEQNVAIYYSELDALYELNNTSVEKRLELFAGKNEVVKQRDDAFIRQIEVLTLAGQADKAIEYLDGVEFAYREGSSRVRETIINAQLIQGMKNFNKKNYEKALHHFLQAQVPDEEAGSARYGNRDLQVNYYIGLAYEALGEKAKAEDYFTDVTQQEPARISIMDFYRGLAFLKVGDKQNAEKVFQAMVTEAEKELQASVTSEAGVIFGEREADEVRRSRYHTMRGLGYKGLGKKKPANDDLKKAVELSYSNLWAKVELDAGY